MTARPRLPERTLRPPVGENGFRTGAITAWSAERSVCARHVSTPPSSIGLRA